MAAIPITKLDPLFPADICEQAKKLIVHCGIMEAIGDQEALVEAVRAVVEFAKMEERERCAHIAESWYEGDFGKCIAREIWSKDQ